MAYATQNSTQGAPAMGGRGLAAAAVIGAMAGVGASLVMAMYAMIAAWTYQQSGFFTPLYHIAAVLIAPEAMVRSMEAAALFGGGDPIRNMAGMVGFPTFALEHLLFGAALGLLLLATSRHRADRAGGASRG